MANQFKNKTVVITGGAGGLATALIDQLLYLGANIAALDLNVDSLTKSKRLLPIAVDITDSSSLQDAVNQVVNYFDGIDILYNNAGITHMSKFKDTSENLFNTIMNVNFTGSVNITRMCLPHLEKSKGQIIAISSVAGFAPLYGRSAYSASKHAMEGFFKTLASEVKDDGISVLIVCPSFVRSRPELQTKANTGISSPGALKKNTVGKQISPEDAANSIIMATEKRRSSLYLGKISIIAYWLNNLLPMLYLKLMTKGAKAEFNSDQ